MLICLKCASLLLSAVVAESGAEAEIVGFPQEQLVQVQDGPHVHSELPHPATADSTGLSLLGGSCSGSDSTEFEESSGEEETLFPNSTSFFIGVWIPAPNSGLIAFF